MQNVHKKYTTASGSCFLPQPRLAGMKNSLVAPALIAIFVRGILAKFSHLQEDRGRTTLFDVYKPFLSSAVFHLKKTPLSECCEQYQRHRGWYGLFFPPSAWNDFIKFALIIPLGGSVLVETAAPRLLLGNKAGYAALFLLSQRCTTTVSNQTLYTRLNQAMYFERTVMLCSIESIFIPKLVICRSKALK